MELTLPPELAGAYGVRPTTPDDHGAVYDLVVADRTHFLGVCRVPKEIVGHWMSPPGPGLSAVVERDGQIQQWWYAIHEAGTTSFWCGVTSRPGLEDVDVFDAVAWDVVSIWAAGVLPSPGAGTLRTGRMIEDEAAHTRLATLGFTSTHTFWQMGGDVPDTPTPAGHQPPAGLVVEGSADPHLVHDVMQEGFAEHYGYSRQSFDDAMPTYRDRPGFDPSGWFLARLDGRPVGAMILSWEAADRGVLFVLELATLKEARGRGVGTTLLRQGFDVARRDGLSRVELFVDAQNSTGAPALYRGVGMDVMQANKQFERPVVLPATGAPQP